MAIIWVLVDFDFVIHRIIGLCQKESPQSFVRSSRKNSGCATKTISILDSLAIPNLSLVGYCNSTRYPRVEKRLRMLDFIDFRKLRSKRGRNTSLVLQYYYLFNVTVNQITRLEICVQSIVPIVFRRIWKSPSRAIRFWWAGVAINCVDFSAAAKYQRCVVLRLAMAKTVIHW